MAKRLTIITLLLALLPFTAVAGNGVPKKSVILAGLDIDSMRVRLDETDMQPLEGIWYYPNEEMTLGIERYRGEHNIGYRIILLESQDINVITYPDYDYGQVKYRGGAFFDSKVAKNDGIVRFVTTA